MRRSNQPKPNKRKPRIWLYSFKQHPIKWIVKWLADVTGVTRDLEVYVIRREGAILALQFDLVEKVSSFKTKNPSLYEAAKKESQGP